MIMYYEVNRDNEVIYCSDFIYGLFNQSGKNEFESLFSIDNAFAFEHNKQLDDFVCCAAGMLEEQFEDITDMEIYFTFCDTDGVLSHSIVYKNEEYYILNWKEKGQTFKVDVDKRNS